MKVAVFGLGYVGCVSATCLSELGHTVVGVDLNSDKVAAICRGEVPIVEPELADRVRRSVAARRLAATTRAAEAMADAEVILICVGTPSSSSGNLDSSHLERVAGEIAGYLGIAAPYPTVVVRSTVLPGSARSQILSVIETGSGLRAGSDFGFCLNPEFLREGTAVADFYSPPFTLVGEGDPRAGDVIARLYDGIEAPFIRTDPETASMVKYASNAYHALKVAFANEIGTLCKTMGVDSHSLMDIFVQDHKLNISPAYLRPGFAFGGSCLPKDLRALVHHARHADLDLPLLSSILPSNEVHLRRVVDLVAQIGRRRIGVIGLTFKPETDDLRESPLALLVETLLGRGYDLRIHDQELSLSRVMGANRQYIDRTIPHLASLLCESLPDLLEHAEVIIVGKRLPGLAESLASHQERGQIVIDFVRLRRGEDIRGLAGAYHGLCW